MANAWDSIEALDPQARAALLARVRSDAAARLPTTGSAAGTPPSAAQSSLP